MTARFLIAEGLASLRRVKAASIIGAFLTGISLAIVGGFILVALAYRAELAIASSATGVEVFLDDGVDSARAMAIADEITAFQNVRSARVRPRAEAEQILGMPQGKELQSVAGAFPLPITIQVEMDEPARTLAAMQQLEQNLREVTGVVDIAFPSDLVRTIDERSVMFLRIAIVLGIALSLGVIGVVATTAQLTIVSRRMVIRTMHLLGAERRWVLAPFVIEGLLIGLAGGILATGFIYSAELIVPELRPLLRGGELTYFPFVFPAIGAVLGMLGATASAWYYAMQGEGV
jgi:cell division transport system permease protein